MQTSNIILSSSSSNTGSGEAADKATCGICRRQVSRYTCPSCNVPYCSLTCFRSNEHAQCSEAFYKQQLESEIRTQPSASAEERRRMLEVLRRFEEEGVESEDLLGGDEEEEEGEGGKDDLAERFGNIDIASASATDIWNALTSEEREAFLSKIRDPTSSSAQELLRSTGSELDVVLPWWETPEMPVEDPSLSAATSKKYGKWPAMEEIPQSLLKRPAGPDSGPPLLYNICAVFVAYAYITRHLGVSPLSQAKDEDDRMSARQLIRELVPFVAEKRSTVLFNSMDDVVTYLWPRLVDGNKANRVSFVVCLRDSARLLTPRRVALIDSSPSSNDNLEATPQRDALLALSDLIALFKSHAQAEVKETPASLRLRFYAAHIATIPSQLLAAFSAEVGTRARSVEAEGESNVQSGSGTSFKPESKSSPPTDSTRKKNPLIEEV